MLFLHVTSDLPDAEEASVMDMIGVRESASFNTDKTCPLKS
jgi:hypothetical protein